MDVSLITSLYRAAAFLEAYTTHVSRVIPVVQDAGITVELIIIVNDATDEERTCIEHLTAALGEAVVRPLYVPRETLYASWNRGVEAARGRAIGFWNVDDVRTPEGIITCWHAITGGCRLAYPKWDEIENRRWLGRISVPHRMFFEAHRERIGPFFMFDRTLFESVGRFDARFRIVGDFEWSLRATRQLKPCPVDVVAGTLYHHGGNLSVLSAELTLEDNIACMCHDMEENLTPAPPEQMRAMYAQWADDLTISDDVADYLWGDGATARWQTYQQQQAKRQRDFRRGDFFRMVPRLLIDRLNIRPLLYRLGVVKSPHRRT